MRQGAPAGDQKADMGNDILLARLDMKPMLEANKVRFPFPVFRRRLTFDVFPVL